MLQEQGQALDLRLIFRLSVLEARMIPLLSLVPNVTNVKAQRLTECPGGGAMLSKLPTKQPS